MTRTTRNIRAVELWLDSHSWRGIAAKLAAEGFGTVSHQYVARVVKRELARAWQNAPVYANFNETPVATEDTPITVRHESNTSDEPETSEITAEIIVESFFTARHFVSIGGVTGVPHGHSYRVRMLARGEIDPVSGTLMGFAEAQAILDTAVSAFGEEFLNRLDLFTEHQPTTENVAVSIAEAVRPQLAKYRLLITGITLWESPTKGVTVSLNPYRPKQPPEISEAGDQPFLSA